MNPPPQPHWRQAIFDAFFMRMQSAITSPDDRYLDSSAIKLDISMNKIRNIVIMTEATHPSVVSESTPTFFESTYM